MKRLFLILISAFFTFAGATAQSKEEVKKEFDEILDAMNIDALFLYIQEQANEQILYSTKDSLTKYGVTNYFEIFDAKEYREFVYEIMTERFKSFEDVKRLNQMLKESKVFRDFLNLKDLFKKARGSNLKRFEVFIDDLVEYAKNPNSPIRNRGRYTEQEYKTLAKYYLEYDKMNCTPADLMSAFDKCFKEKKDKVNKELEAKGVKYRVE